MDIAGGLLGVVDSALKLGSSVVDRLNLKDRQKYIDRVREVKLQLMAEDAKPDGTRSDALLEDLEQLLHVELESMNNAISAGVLEAK